MSRPEVMTAKFYMIVVGIAVVRGTRPSQLVYHLFHHLDRLLLEFVAIRVICQRNGRARPFRSEKYKPGHFYGSSPRLYSNVAFVE